MSVTTLNKVNQGINSIAKQFHNIAYSGGASISAMKKLIFISTDKSSAKLSTHILKDLETFLNNLPKTDEQIKITQLKKKQTLTNNNIQFVEKILNDIDLMILVEGAKIEVDDKNMQTFLSNFNKIKSGLEYASDYLNLISETYKAKKEIKDGKSKTYSLDELLEELKK